MEFRGVRKILAEKKGRTVALQKARLVVTQKRNRFYLQLFRLERNIKCTPSRASQQVYLSFGKTLNGFFVVAVCSIYPPDSWENVRR